MLTNAKAKAHDRRTYLYQLQHSVDETARGCDAAAHPHRRPAAAGRRRRRRRHANDVIRCGGVRDGERSRRCCSVAVRFENERARGRFASMSDRRANDAERSAGAVGEQMNKTKKFHYAQ